LQRCLWSRAGNAVTGSAYAQSSEVTLLSERRLEDRVSTVWKFDLARRTTAISTPNIAIIALFRSFLGAITTDGF
jgi:hypothetical protein